MYIDVIGNGKSYNKVSRGNGVQIEVEPLNLVTKEITTWSKVIDSSLEEGESSGTHDKDTN